MPKKAFRFPILSYNDIIACLKEIINIQITPDQLKDPKKDMVESIFKQLLIACGINQYSLENVDFNIIDPKFRIQKEQYMDALVQMELYSNM